MAPIKRNPFTVFQNNLARAVALATQLGNKRTKSNRVTGCARHPICSGKSNVSLERANVL